MKTHSRLKKLSLGLIGMFALIAVAKAPAYAVGLTGVIDIHVSISATKSLLVGTTSYNFGALSVNTSSVSAVAILVRNDSGSLVETYTVQGSSASSASGNGWQLVASTGVVDEYMLQAQFATGRPADTDGTWTSDSLTTSAQVCTASRFAAILGESGVNVSPSPTASAYDRNLWFRMITPAYVSDTTQRNAVVTLAIQ